MLCPDFNSILPSQVVNHYYTQVADLFDKGTTARLLIVPESIENFKRVMTLLPNMRRLNSIKLEDEQIQEMLKSSS